MGNYECCLNLKVFLLLSLCPLISPYNILVVSPAVSKSHFNVGEAISIGLSDAGHKVTLISPFDYKPKSANIEPVQITGAIEKSEGKPLLFSPLIHSINNSMLAKTVDFIRNFVQL